MTDDPTPPQQSAWQPPDLPPRPPASQAPLIQPYPTYPPPGTPTSAPQRPARPKGLGGALAAAIIVSTLPVLGFVGVISWAAAIVVAESTASTGAAAGPVMPVEAEGPASPLAAVIPDDLPWDVRLGGDAYTWMVDSFPTDPAWEQTGDANEPDYNFTNIAYENLETGCFVWFANGPLEAIDVTHGDRVASVGLLGYALELQPADADVADGSIATIRADGTRQGRADAVEVDLSEGGWSGVAVARAFPSIGEGVVYTVECPDEVQLDAARGEVDDLLQIALTSVLPGASPDAEPAAEAPPTPAEPTPMATEQSTPPLSPVIVPRDLPWDVQLGGEAYTWIENSFPSSPDWREIGSAGTSGEYEHRESGCRVAFGNQPLTGIDATHGDRVASVDLLRSSVYFDVPAGDVHDTRMVGVGDGVQSGIVDAVAVDMPAPFGPGVVVARAFPSTGEGVSYSIECDDEALVPAMRAEVDELLAVKLIPAS